MIEDAHTAAAALGDALAATASGCGSSPAYPSPGRRGRVRIAVAGEFNSGKTTLVNALVGAPVLNPSMVVHTAHPTVIAFAAKPSLSAETLDRRRMAVEWSRVEDVATGIRRLHVGAPLERLKAFSVIDTPGLGFADGESDRRSFDACRNADVVIWCTPAMQAWKASEERAWLALPERVRKRGVLAVTFADEIASLADVNRLMQRLAAEAGPYFGGILLSSDCASAVLKAGKRYPYGQACRAFAPQSAMTVASTHLR